LPPVAAVTCRRPCPPGQRFGASALPWAGGTAPPGRRPLLPWPDVRVVGLSTWLAVLAGGTAPLAGGTCCRPCSTGRRYVPSALLHWPEVWAGGCLPSALPLWPEVWAVGLATLAGGMGHRHCPPGGNACRRHCLQGRRPCPQVRWPAGSAANRAGGTAFQGRRPCHPEQAVLPPCPCPPGRRHCPPGLAVRGGDLAPLVGGTDQGRY